MSLSLFMGHPLEEVLRGLLDVAPRLPYRLHVATVSSYEAFPLAGLEGVQVGCTQVEHDVPCLAYSLWVYRASRFAPERAQVLGLLVKHWDQLQLGQSVRLAVVPSSRRRCSARRVRV